MDVYLVGGALRDEALGVEPRERDWCVVGATPEDLKAEGSRIESYATLGSECPETT
jgi:tRNA nucleotidyltransferase (CCA-adding enzyme)